MALVTLIKGIVYSLFILTLARNSYSTRFPCFTGSRTPHYGSMTPSHDPSRTPLHGGAWDPTQPNTPARNEDFDYNFDTSTPSPGVSFISDAGYYTLAWKYTQLYG